MSARATNGSLMNDEKTTGQAADCPKHYTEVQRNSYLNSSGHTWVFNERRGNHWAVCRLPQKQRYTEVQ